MPALPRNLAALALAGLLAGCAAKRTTRAPWAGPTEPMDVVVARINERNVRIDKLRGEGRFEADLVDPRTKKHEPGDGDITLMYMPRRSLFIRGRVLGQDVFRIGSNDERFWLILKMQDTMYWGEHRLVGGARLRELPVRPDLLAEVLAVGPIEADLLKQPTPVMRFNNDQHAYMFTWNVQLSDRWAVQKEVWYDRETLLPKLVLLFDENGRIVLRAYLQRPVDAEGFDAPVKVASVYDMYFPDTGSKFRMEFDEWKRENRGAPSPRTFNYPGDDPGVSNVVPLDE
ncbi:MAG TPA: hypothetical protein VF624_12505 [Tepidisphaeraceae bacterium]|jgi:hypothetical protein